MGRHERGYWTQPFWRPLWTLRSCRSTTKIEGGGGKRLCCGKAIFFPNPGTPPRAPNGFVVICISPIINRHRQWMKIDKLHHPASGLENPSDLQGHHRVGVIGFPSPLVFVRGFQWASSCDSCIPVHFPLLAGAGISPSPSRPCMTTKRFSVTCGPASSSSHPRWSQFKGRMHGSCVGLFFIRGAGLYVHHHHKHRLSLE